MMLHHWWVNDGAMEVFRLQTTNGSMVPLQKPERASSTGKKNYQNNIEVIWKHLCLYYFVWVWASACRPLAKMQHAHVWSTRSTKATAAPFDLSPAWPPWSMSSVKCRPITNGKNLNFSLVCQFVFSYW